MERELEWFRLSPKGRHARSQTRISAYDKLLNQEVAKQEKELELYILPGPRLGIEAQQLQFEEEGFLAEGLPRLAGAGQHGCATVVGTVEIDVSGRIVPRGARGGEAPISAFVQGFSHITPRL